MNYNVLQRDRKSPFVRFLNHTSPGIVCNQFYELRLSNGCPFNCQYCYLKLDLRGDTGPVIFTNPWEQVERSLDQVSAGVFSTGEMADSLAITPPLLRPALTYFRRQKDKFLFLTTKSDNVSALLALEPTPQVWISFSINAVKAWERFEANTPHPYRRLAAARALKDAGWRVRVRIDPMIAEIGLDHYRDTARRVNLLAPERVTLGTLRRLPGLFGADDAAPPGLLKSPTGVRWYPVPLRAQIYSRMADWLGFQPALCRETNELWEHLGWQPNGCNCTTKK